jgi:hypothetical protein
MKRRYRMRPIVTLLISLALSTISWAASAQSPGSDRFGALVNLEGPSVAEPRTVAGHVDARFFNHPEGITYTSLSIRYGLFHHLEVGLRGATGATQALLLPGGGSILHGGQDAELYGKYDVGSFGNVRLAISGGVSSPDTPAQSQGVATASGSASIKLHDRVTAYLNPRAVFIEDNTIVGVGAGASIRVSDHVHIVGDWTTIVSGENTRDTITGARKRGNVWGAALRFSSPTDNGHVDFDIGYGNGTGSTTGFSLTPGLGNSAGFYFALHARR